HPRYRDGRQEIERIPDAALGDDAVDRSAHGHRARADEAASDAGRQRLNLDWNSYAMPVVTEREALDAPRRRGRPRRNALRRRYRHVLHALHGQHVAPPSDTTDEGEHDAHHAHGEVSHQPGESKRHAERDDHRPHGGSGKLEAVEAFRICHGVSTAGTGFASTPATLTARATAAPRMRLPMRRCVTGRNTTVVCPPGIHRDEKRARKLPAPRMSWTPRRTSSRLASGAATASPVRRNCPATSGTTTNTRAAPARWK